MLLLLSLELLSNAGELTLLKKLLLVSLLALHLLFGHVLDRLRQSLDKVFELDEVRLQVDASIVSLGRLCLATTTFDAKHGQQVYVVLAQLRTHNSQDFLELLSRDDLAGVLAILAAKLHVDLTLQRLYFLLACV